MIAQESRTVALARLRRLRERKAGCAWLGEWLNFALVVVAKDPVANRALRNSL